jgi:4a-hydroxytetrahydrobiopterin dehydratase
MKLGQPAISSRLSSLPRWTHISAPVDAIERSFKFKDFHHTMAFVNALAWIAHCRDHHPDLQVGYNTCTVRYSTHSDGGLTEKDFASATAVDALLGG